MPPVFYCCIPTCKSTGKSEKLHRFPTQEDLFQKWLRAVKRQDLEIMEKKKVRESYRICDKHFSQEHRIPAQYGSLSGLVVTAVPTLQLCHDVLVPMEDTYRATSSSPQDILNQPEPSTSRVQSFSRQHTPESSTKAKVVTSRQGVRRKLNLLQALNVTRSKQLTPKAKILYKMAKDLKKTAADLDRENLSTKDKLHKALEYAESGELLKNKVNKATMRFITSQIEMQKKHPKGRRFTTDDKVFALSIMKASPKGYRLLEKVFALPSKKTLMQMLQKLPFGSGLNLQILECLRDSIKDKTSLENYCILMYDEMSIESSLSYHSKEDIIHGFADQRGDYVKTELADHALVFMVRGIARKWKQPVAYFFTSGGMKSIPLANNIENIILALQQIGLKVVATVSDQMTTNVAANRHLMKKTREYCLKENIDPAKYLGYLINKQEVIFLYDAPHILKGIRNNLVNHNIRFKWLKEEHQTASWKDIVAVYEHDVQPADFKLCSKLTEQHVYPHKLKKMKVKMAAQVFSQRVSAIMRHIARSEPSALPATASGTADFLLFVDKLFDSMNGSHFEPESGKMLQCAIKSTSQHLEFWDTALKVLSNIQFITEDNKLVPTPPTIQNCITTIRGIRYLWQKLVPVGFKLLCPRNLNQDPLENFFGCIRSQAGRNINPTVSSFVSSYKTLLVNNFTSTHSPGANCEFDISEGALNTLRHFLERKIREDDGVNILVQIEEEDEEDNFAPKGRSSSLTLDLNSYLAGFLAKKILKNINCPTCRSNLVGEERNSLTEARAYNPRALVNAHPKFRDLFTKCCETMHFFLPKVSSTTNVAGQLKLKLRKFVLFENNWKCNEHNLEETFLNIFVPFYIYAWIGNVNKILKGQDQRNINDCVKQMAVKKYNQNKIKSKKITSVKQLI